LHEVGPAFFDDCLHNFSVYVGDPDAHDSADHKQHREEDQVLRLNAGPTWDDFFQKLKHALPEEFVNVAFSFRLQN
jgi:hypothetical protein